MKTYVYKNYEIIGDGLNWKCYVDGECIGLGTKPHVFYQLIYMKELEKGIDKKLTEKDFDVVRES